MEENLKDKLLMKKENGWKNLETRDKEAIFSFCNGYINFLNNSKTEREAIQTAKKIAESNGFRDISEYESLNPGDKVYFINARSQKNFCARINRTSCCENVIH